MGVVRYRNTETGSVASYGRVMPLLESSPKWERYAPQPGDAAKADAPAVPVLPFPALVAGQGEADDLLGESDG